MTDDWIDDSFSERKDPFDAIRDDFNELKKRIDNVEKRTMVAEPRSSSPGMWLCSLMEPRVPVNEVVRLLVNHLGLEIGYSEQPEEKYLFKKKDKK